MLARGEVDREARRVLPRLLKVDGRLVRLENSDHALVAAHRDQPSAKAVRISEAVVEALRARDFLVREIDHGSGEICHRLSEAGAAYVRRLRAPNDGFRAQHRAMGRRRVELHPGVSRMVDVNDGESPLGWLARRRGADGQPLVSRVALEAGERLRRDFTLANLDPRLTTDWSFVSSAPSRRAAPSGPDVRDHVIAAKARLERALAHVGPGLADVLLETCCFLHGLEEAEKALGWPQRSAKVVLRIALERLAGHYGITQKPDGRPGRIRSWRAAGG